MVKTWERLLKSLDRQKRLNWSQAMGEWRLFACNKEGAEVGKTKKGKGMKLMLMTDGNGVPISGFTISAQVAEGNTIETMVDIQVAGQRPERLLYDMAVLYDMAADADGVRDPPKLRGIEQITPHRKGRKKPSRQDGRSLRRYASRWKVERTISWPGYQRRLLVRQEYYPHLFEGFSTSPA
ncbi:transposase [Schlesneria sp. T3-172]|uniref:transposase n=1 Tax=Schlesneria sphaerica TaxID=3373610 RepID=UPI0037C82889